MAKYKKGELRYLVHATTDANGREVPFAIVEIIKCHKVPGSYNYIDYWVKLVQILDKSGFNNYIPTYSKSGNMRWKDRLIGKKLTKLDKALR